MHLSAAQFDEEEDVQPLQPDALDGEEVDREQALPMRSDECAPRQASARPDRSRPRVAKPRADGRRRYHDPQALQLADNAVIAPPRILAREAQYEFAQFPADGWPAWSSRVRPSLGHQPPMPRQPRGGRDDEGPPVMDAP